MNPLPAVVRFGVLFAIVTFAALTTVHVASTADLPRSSPTAAPDGEAKVREVAPAPPATAKLRETLVLRVWNTPAKPGEDPHIDIVSPSGLRRLPYQLGKPSEDSATDEQDEPRPETDQTEAPRLAPQCRLVRTYVPEGQSSVRYYIYNVDLSDPRVVENWRALQRAERQQAREAKMERQSDRAWERRKQQLLTAHALATQEGIALLQAGEYRSAMISLTRAAELNQGDPGCRIHLAQARMALGHDLEAGKAVRRALELRPSMVPRQLDLEDCYPSPRDFSDHVDALANRLSKRAGAAADEYFLLGFMEFQRGRMDAAHAAFRRAAPGLRNDRQLRTYLDLTKPATP